MQIELMSITDNAEDVIERACRTCYLSFDRYNPPESTAELIQKVIKKGHHSVLEHAMATFRIKGCSRVMTHELVRHRIMSPSQESQRYCIYADKPGRKKTKNFEYVMPKLIVNCKKDVIFNFQNSSYEIIENAGDCDEYKKIGTMKETFNQIVGSCWALYELMLDAGIPPEDARYILPNATTSEIVVSANLREWRHIFTLRGNPRAHWEIRQVAIEIFRILKEKCPNVFFDFEEGDQCIIKK